jgi:hypothetical protein
MGFLVVRAACRRPVPVELQYRDPVEAIRGPSPAAAPPAASAGGRCQASERGQAVRAVDRLALKSNSGGRYSFRLRPITHCGSPVRHSFPTLVPRRKDTRFFTQRRRLDRLSRRETRRKDRRSCYLATGAAARRLSFARSARDCLSRTNCWSASTPIRMTVPMTAKLSELGMPSRLTRFCKT